MAYPVFLKCHDPNAGISGPWTIPVLLDDAVTLSSGSVTVVDKDDNPIVGTDLIVSDVSIGQIVDDVWGVSFYLDGGTLGFYFLRFRFTTSAPQSPGDDCTMRVQVKNN